MFHLTPFAKQLCWMARKIDLKGQACNTTLGPFVFIREYFHIIHPILLLWCFCGVLNTMRYFIDSRSVNKSKPRFVGRFAGLPPTVVATVVSMKEFIHLKVWLLLTYAVWKLSLAYMKPWKIYYNIFLACRLLKILLTAIIHGVGATKLEAFLKIIYVGLNIGIVILIKRICSIIIKCEVVCTE